MALKSNCKFRKRDSKNQRWCVAFIVRLEYFLYSQHCLVTAMPDELFDVQKNIVIFNIIILVPPRLSFWDSGPSQVDGETIMFWFEDMPQG